MVISIIMKWTHLGAAGENHNCTPKDFCFEFYIKEIKFSRLKHMSHQTIIHRQKRIGRKKKIGRFLYRFIFHFLVSFIFIIVGNPPIWVSHSPTIKKLFLRALDT